MIREKKISGTTIIFNALRKITLMIDVNESSQVWPSTRLAKTKPRIAPPKTYRAKYFDDMTFTSSLFYDSITFLYYMGVRAALSALRSSWL